MLSPARKTRFVPIFGFLIVLAALLPAYLSVLQTIPNGADNGYMADVGETQIVLNVWGTLHATGYPLFIMTGATLVSVFKALGVNAATAPALVSMFWGLIALSLIYSLALHLTGRTLAATAMTLIYGLTRTVWIHHDIAEVYTFGLAILALLLLIALWRGPIRHRVYWLALIGGIGVAEHRAIAMVAPALVFAVWRELTARPKRLPLMLAICLLLGLIGFLPYIYLPLRAQAGAPWVYGEPGTLAGLWDQFTGREASRFIGAPSTLDAFAANLALINNVLITDLTIPGLLLGALGLTVGIARRPTRRAALTLILSGLAAYVFHIAFYSDVLFALILPVTLSFAFGWLFLLDALLADRKVTASARMEV